MVRAKALRFESVLTVGKTTTTGNAPVGWISIVIQVSGYVTEPGWRGVFDATARLLLAA